MKRTLLISAIAVSFAAVHGCGSDRVDTRGNSGTQQTSTGTGKGADATAGCSSLTGVVSYNGQIAPLLKAHCVSCHHPGKQGPELSTYAGVVASALPVLAAIELGKMPPKGPALEAADKATFAAWVAGGMTEGSATPQPTETPTATETGTGTAPAVNPNCTATGSATATATGSEGATETATATATATETETATATATSTDTATATTTATGSGTGTGTGTLAITYAAQIKPLVDGSCGVCHGQLGPKPALTTYDQVKAATPKCLSEMAAGSMPPAGGPVSAANQALWAAWAAGGFQP